MRSLLAAAGPNTDGLLVQREAWDTHVYMKPHERQKEQHRIDFGNFNQLQVSTLQQLLDAVEAALPDLDILIVNQQVLSGLHTPGVRDALRALIAAHPGPPYHRGLHGTIRMRTGSAMRKINVAEATRVLQGSRGGSGGTG